jgi:hypothetical protein
MEYFMLCLSQEVSSVPAEKTQEQNSAVMYGEIVMGKKNLGSRS